MEFLKYDVIIIGGGLAGLRAAAAVYHASLGRLSAAIISKVPPMRSHSIAAEGGMAAVLYPELTGDSYEQHAYDTVKGGDFLVDQDAALLLAQEAPKEIWFLEKIGVPWNRDSEGRIALRRFGGMSKPRTAFAQDKTGLHIMSKLYAYVNKLKAFDFYTDFIVTKLIIEGGEFRGVVGLDLKRGEVRAFLAKAGIIATGGAGRLYKFTTNSYVVTGEMLGFAMEAGVALKDMEFVQWHPTALVPSGVLISEAARAEGAYLVNREGERFMLRYSELGELAPRDVVSRAIIFEISEGRGFVHEESGMGYVGLDVRHIPEEKLKERLPLLMHLAKTYAGVDPLTELIPVRPAVHYTMGGIHADTYGRVLTPDGQWVRGLWVAGEAAAISVHGANRLGSNSLSECAVWGRLTGEQAAKYAMEKPEPSVDLRLLEAAKSEEARIFDRLLHTETGGISVYELIAKLNEAMEEGVGILRHSSKMAEAIAAIKRIGDELARVRLEDRGRVYNSNLRDLLQLTGMIKAAEAVAKGAYLREESRGAHYRLDYPRRDERWTKHTIYFLYGGSVEVKYAEVRRGLW